MKQIVWYNNKCLDGTTWGGFVFAPHVNTISIGQTAPYERTIVPLRLGNGGKSHGGRCVMLTETEKAYLAGVVDADGCITIICSKSGISPSHTLLVSISQANQPFLERWCQKAELGGVYRSKKAGDNEGLPFTRHRDQYLWNISAGKAEGFLIDLLPYLDIKKPQAELALRFRKIKKAETTVATARLSVAAIERREQCKQEIMALNKRIPFEPTPTKEDEEETTKQLTLF